MLPQSFEEWRHCIEEKCKIPLTPGYIETRIAALQLKDSKEVKDFVRLYGEDHLEKVLGFFQMAQNEKAAGGKAS